MNTILSLRNCWLHATEFQIVLVEAFLITHCYSVEVPEPSLPYHYYTRIARCNSLDLWLFNAWSTHSSALPDLFQGPANPYGFAACLVPPDDTSFRRLSPPLWATHLCWFHEFWVGDGPHIRKTESLTGLDVAIITTPSQSQSSSLCNILNIQNFPPSQGKIMDSARVFVTRRLDKCNLVVKSIS